MDRKGRPFYTLRGPDWYLIWWDWGAAVEDVEALAQRISGDGGEVHVFCDDDLLATYVDGMRREAEER